MSDVLDTILARKREELVLLAQRYSTPELEALAAQADAPRGFAAALRAKAESGGVGVIAEIKRASPSKGLIRADFDPAWIAREYAAGGAACLSVLTDEQFFQGHNAFLVQARAACALPAIRKDFLIDEAQLLEARALAADCVLLIAAALAPERLMQLYRFSEALGMDVLVEVHDADELAAVLDAGLPRQALLGINNRNLRTFETRLEITLELLASIPAGYAVVTESGIADSGDVRRMCAAGVRRFLVGESLMRQPRPGSALAALIAL
jgi:indole-3-glycerol phosphate synthase